MEMDERQLTALVVNTVREAISAQNAEDEIEALKTKNAELEDELEGLKGEKKDGEGKNAAFEGKETKEEEDEEEQEKKEGATLENAKPSQAMVAAFATALNVDFGAKTPSFLSLASLTGIKENNPALRIAAVNAKFAELQKLIPADKSAMTATSEVF